MDNEIIFIIEEDSLSGYTARALGHSIFTEAEDLEDLKDRIREAVKCHFVEQSRPGIIRLHYVKDEVIALWNFPGT